MNDETRRPRILIAEPFDPVALEKLRAAADVDILSAGKPQTLSNLVQRYDALIAPPSAGLDVTLLDQAPRLQAIASNSATLEGELAREARQRGIEIINAAGEMSSAVAEHTLGLMLSMARHIPQASAGARTGHWEQPRALSTGLAGRTLGIIGYGAIGRQVAQRARAFEMRLLVSDPNVWAGESPDAEIEPATLHDLLAASDFVTIHVSALPSTASLIGAAELARMQPGAYLINTSRGNVVDLAALQTALDEKPLGGVAIDVFDGDPRPPQALVNHDRVLVTPHVGSRTEDERRAAALSVADQLIAFFEETAIDPLLPLRIVPSDRVYPHEHFDQKRVARLARRLDEDGSLSNPPIVVRAENGYMVLDGATRSTAMRQLGLPHMVVQIVTPGEGLRLKTWYHAIRQMRRPALEALLRGIPDVELLASTAETALQEMYEYGGLCYLHFPSGDVLLVRAAASANRFDVLNAVTNAYIDAGYVSRTLEREVGPVAAQFADLTALVVFPEYTVEQVMQIVAADRLLPAGITRFIIPGRVLRVNLDLSLLRADLSLREKNRRLHELLLARQAAGGIRYYAEPVYLLDE